MESERLLLMLVMVFVFGVGSQWLASWLRAPAILFLLISGFLAGPVLGFLEPDKLLGALLPSFIALSVSLVLFEGGLTLRIDEFRGIWRSLAGLLTIGALVTWIGGAFGARFILGMPIPASLVLGAILVVTGPTVIGPLLRDIRPIGRVGPIAKWEGIVIDPLGATLAVLVFEATQSWQESALGVAAWNAIKGMSLMLLVGAATGAVAAWLIVYLLKRFWIADHLQNAVVLMAVMAIFTLAEFLHHESGLLAVTLMGLILANQRIVSVQRIVEFKESLTVLLIATLFIILAARTSLSDLTDLGWRGVVYALSLIVVVRPLAVWTATIGAGLNLRERLFLSWFAPRGIVAAAVAAVFALQMGVEGATIAPGALFVVFVTVAVYGLTARPLARRLGLAVANPQGVLIAGANSFSRGVAAALRREGFEVLLVDSQYERVRQARSEGLTAQYANVLSEHLLESLDFGGLGRFLGLTANHEVNTLAAARFRELFGQKNVWQLAIPKSGQPRSTSDLHHLEGRPLFHADYTYERLYDALENGAIIKATPLTKEFDFEAFRAHYGERACPLFLIQGDRLTVLGANDSVAPKAGHSIVSLILPPENALASGDVKSESPSLV